MYRITAAVVEKDIPGTCRFGWGRKYKTMRRALQAKKEFEAAYERFKLRNNWGIGDFRVEHYYPESLYELRRRAATGIVASTNGVSKADSPAVAQIL